MQYWHSNLDKLASLKISTNKLGAIIFCIDRFQYGFITNLFISE